MRRRPAAVAGTFYPSNREELEEQIRGFLAAAGSTLGPEATAPKAVIAPHAGTVYSGPIAATVYARLARARGRIRRVVLLGPAHRVWFRGLAATSAEVFATPLGDVPIDREVVDRLLELPQVAVNDEAHRQEHSLEVHLPFLQVALGAFSLVPLVVGEASAALVGEVLDVLWGGDETFVVVSSDLSHFHSYEAARALDAETTQLIEGLRFEALDGERACGYQPIRGLLHTAKRRGLHVANVDLRSSGDTAGPRREVVGYGAYVVG